MNFVSKYIEDLRKQYRQEQARKATVKLLYSSKAVRKGKVSNGIWKYTDKRNSTWKRCK